MGISVADNFSYLGGKPLDGRIQYATLATMKAMADATLYEGCEAYCIETDKYYKWLSSNTVDAQTGKWREVSSGGGETYSDFTGATASTAGAHGLVPAPSAGDEGKVLFGNGAWGALPSVDLSVLSNEAFQLSYNEKPVGTSVSGKLLYSKTLDFGDLPNQTTKRVSLGVANVESVETIFFEVFYSDSGTYLSFPVGYMPTGGGVSIYESIEYRNGNVIYMTTADRRGCTAKATVFYTKTTDSPLPSDVKFAGLLSDGTVVYKKTVSTGGSVPSGATLIYRLPLLNSTDIVYYTLAS